MEPLLQAEHITICYNGKPVVKDVSFNVDAGEILGVVGESGSGLAGRRRHGDGRRYLV